MPVDYHLTIKELPAEGRPRERLLTRGPQSLANAELLAIVLRTGTDQESALDLANRILAHPEGLRFLATASLEELQEFRGVGQAKACQIAAAVELGKRLAASGAAVRPQVQCPADVATLLQEEMRYLDREHFLVLLLNTKNHVLAIERVSVGSLNASLVHPREVFKAAIRQSAAAIILAHNHPSGDPFPSGDDLEVTRRLVEAGKILGIDVLDHMIFGDARYLSLKETGKL